MLFVWVQYTWFHTRIHFYITRSYEQIYRFYIEGKVVSLPLLLFFRLFLFVYRSKYKRFTILRFAVTSFHSTIFYTNHIKYIRILLQDKSETKILSKCSGAFATKNREICGMYWCVLYQGRRTPNICSLLLCSFLFLVAFSPLVSVRHNS